MQCVPTQKDPLAVTAKMDLTEMEMTALVSLNLFYTNFFVNLIENKFA